MSMKSRFAVTVLGAAVLLSACSSTDDILGFGEEQVDYKSTVRGDPLSLPPDLSKAQINPRYDAGAVASANAYAQASKDAAKSAQNSSAVLPESGDVQVLRSGSDRWLVISRDPKFVYNKVIEFWNEQGFTINEDNPTAGIVRTDWAENRAKIPGNFLRRVVGSLIDLVSDSGERERFTTRLERANGKTEVHINHERMVETPMDRDGNEFKWLPAKEDPGLNAVMIARFMQYLGINQDKAADQVRQAKTVQTLQVSKNIDFDASKDGLVTSIAAPEAWQRVGNALQAAGFTVVNRDQSKGTYEVRYLDTDNGVVRKAGNIFTRMWGSNGNLSPEVYTIHVRNDGAQTVITADNLAKEDQASATSTARRILRVVAEKF
ncbi:outer membrane protein assembly factor BamC [Brackiella oedipodis]|uniref:outer membrane protein assembly factor BamC n=1 Tax=Brackiella oedipodis TaxID=124225 RepID=UPI00048E1B48|nr:outer membrane protein assembly factor BamC [Brackiella oedipodis]